MFRSTAIILAVLSTTAQAECYVRSAMTGKAQITITDITDVQNLEIGRAHV